MRLAKSFQVKPRLLRGLKHPISTPCRLPGAILTLLLTSLAPAAAQAQNVWRGGVVFHSGNWSTPVNWSLDMVPDGTTDVSIPIGISTDNINVNFFGHTLDVSAQLNINAGVQLSFADATLSIASSGVVDNAGQLNGSLERSFDLINAGTLTNSVTGSLNLQEGSSVENTGVVNNGGALNIIGGAAATFSNAGGILNNSGTLSNQGLLENEAVFDGLHLNHGEINNTGLLVNGSSTSVGNLTNDALTFISNSGFLGNSFGSNFTNFGTVQNQSGGLLDNEGEFANDAVMMNALGAIVQNRGFLGNFGTFTNNGANDPELIAGLQNLASGAISNFGTLINNGTMGNRGSFFNSMTIQNGPVPTVTTSFSNLGILVNQGTITNLSLFTNSGTLTNSGTITNFTTVVGPTFTVVGTIQNLGNIDNQAEGSITNQGTLTNTGTLTNAGNLVNSANGTISNAGTLVNQPLGFFDNAGFIDNSGSITNAQQGILENTNLWLNSGSMTNNSSTIIIGAGFVNSSSANLRNLGQIANNGSMKNSGILFNDLSVDQDGNVLTLFANPGTFTNSGSVVNSSIFTNSGTVLNTGTFSNQVSHFMSRDLTVIGTIQNSGLFDNQRGGAVTSFGSFTNTGTLNNEFEASFTNTGTLNNEVGGVINAFDTIVNNGVINNAGTLNILVPAIFGINNTGGIINDSGIINGDALVSNVTGGTIHVLTGGQFNNLSGSVRVDTFDVAGGLRDDGAVVMTGGTPLLITSTGTLSGTGSVTGNVMMQGAISPGDSPGTLHITGNYAQTGTAVFIFETLGTGAGQADELIVNGNISLNGAFDVDLLNGFAPTSGNSWVVLDYTGTRTGTFASELFPALSSGLGWMVFYDDANTDVMLDVCTLGSANCVAGTETGGGGGGGGGGTGGSPTPEPGTLMLFGSGMCGIGLAINKFRGRVRSRLASNS